MRTACTLVALCLLSASIRFASAVDIAVDGATAYQTMDGFGTSVMNWMSGPFGDAALRTTYAQDLGCSLVRGELHPAAITKADCMNANRTTFGPNIDSNVALMNFTSHYRISITGGFMKAVYAQRLDEMKIMLTIWTPPDWMKANTRFGAPGCQSYGGHLVRTDEMRTQYARYVAAWIKGFTAKYGIPVYCLSVQNELDWAHDPSTYTTGCQYFATKLPGGAERSSNGPPTGTNDYNPVVKRIHQELEANGMGAIKFFGPEKSHILSGEFEMAVQMNFIKDMAADGTMDIMDGFCHHGYAHKVGNRALPTQYWNGRTDANPDLNWPGIKTFKKQSWQTEAGNHPISWQGAMDLARCIQDEIVAAGTCGYLPWNYAADSNDEFAMVVNGTQRSDKFYAFKHFSRYIRPGAVRLACSPDDPAGLSVSAFRHAANASLTIVMINAGSAQTARVTIPSGPPDITTFSVFTTKQGAPWVQSSANVQAGVVSVQVPASSFVTLYGQDPTAAHSIKRRTANYSPSSPAGPGRRINLRVSTRPAGLTLVAFQQPNRHIDLVGRWANAR